jgi:hypothetical protein
MRCVSLLLGLVLLSGQVSSGETGSRIVVAAGGDLQRALTMARPGDTIVLEAGATYVGNFQLPAKGAGDAYITIRSSGSDSSLPGATTRMTPEFAAQLPKIKSPNSMPAMATQPGAHHYRLLFLEFSANAQGLGDIITFGDGSPAQNTLAGVPHHLIVDRCYIHGDPAQGQKRGVALNSAATSVINSYISDIKAVGQDSQALGGWNGPGPFTITNNYLEAAGENVMFGGGDPSIPNLVPSDISITGNHLFKPPAWRGGRWQVKNLLELKNARRVTISRNVLEHNWQAAQSGFAVLFTVRNQDGKCGWCQVEQVVFERNILRHIAAGFSILGRDNLKPSQQTRDITIRHNVISDLDPKKWGGNGYFLLMTEAPRDIVVDHNTIIQDHASGILAVGGPPVLEFEFTNNVVRHGAYGIFGDNNSPGQSTITAFFPGSLISGNVIAEANPRLYPGGNRFPSLDEFRRQFAAYEEGDYRLVPGSPWRNAGTDGLDIGAVGLWAEEPQAQPRQPRRRSDGADPRQH